MQKIKREEEFIDFNNDALFVHNKVRALARLGAYAYFQDRRLKIFKTEPVFNVNYNLKPGTIASVEKDFFVVTCINGSVRVLRGTA